MPSLAEISALSRRQELLCTVHCPGAGACPVAIDSHTTAAEVRPEKDPLEPQPFLPASCAPALLARGPQVCPASEIHHLGEGYVCGGTERPPVGSAPPEVLRRPLCGLTFPSRAFPSRWLESWWGGWAWPEAATLSRCMSSEAPRSEPWLGGRSWPTCSPGLRSKCPAPALLCVSPPFSKRPSVLKQTYTSACYLP